MNQQPRRNEDRLYRYPMRRVSGILDHESQVRSAVKDLERTGVDVTGVNILSGREGARLLDRYGKRLGLGARLLRQFQRTGYETAALEIHDQALRAGRHVVYVPVRDADEAVRVAAVLRGAGASYLLYFRPWSIEQMRS